MLPGSKYVRYYERYFNRERKLHMVFKRLSERFIAYGSVKEKKRTRRKTATDGNVINILAAVQSNSMICTRQLERECELSRRLILRILSENKFYPYSLASKFRRI